MFSIYKKKNLDRTGPSRGGPAPGGQRWDGFGFFEFGPPWNGPFGPCGTVDRGPCGTVDRPGLDRTVFNTLGPTQTKWTKSIVQNKNK
jgi:hypothetical protein